MGEARRARYTGAVSFVDLPVAHGRLEALYWKVERPRAAAVVCHPHPLHGGTMHNHVTYRIAQTFRDNGVSCVRFNFRGVGRSTGVHDGGVGEIEDARAALDWLAAQEPGVPLWLGGFSFGARTALQLALRDQRVEKILAVGLAVDIFDLSFVTGLEQPTAFVHSDQDEYGKLENVRALLTKVPAKHALFVVPGADHLCNGRLDEFSVAAKQAFDWLVTA